MTGDPVSFRRCQFQRVAAGDLDQCTPVVRLGDTFSTIPNPVNKARTAFRDMGKGFVINALIMGFTAPQNLSLWKQ